MKAIVYNGIAPMKQDIVPSLVRLFSTILPEPAPACADCRGFGHKIVYSINRRMRKQANSIRCRRCGGSGWQR